MLRLLGLLAQTMRWGPERSDRLVRFPILVLSLAMWTAIYGLACLLEANANSTTPQALGVAELSGKQVHQDYVKLHGAVVPGSAFRVGGDSYVVFRQDGGSAAIILKISKGTQAPPTGVIGVEGILHFLPLSMARDLPADNASLTYNRDQFLVVGERPAPAWLAWLVLLPSSALAILFAVVVIRGGVIFRPGPLPENGNNDVPNRLPVRLIGRLWCERTAGDFFDIDANLIKQPLGFALEAERNGLHWNLQVSPESLQRTKAGQLYLGKKELPAIRFRSVDKHRRASITLILTDDSDLQRAWNVVTSSSEATP